MLFLAISSSELRELTCVKGIKECVFASIPKSICKIGMIEAKENRLNIVDKMFSSRLATTNHL